MEIKNVLSKLAKARLFIKGNPIKREGKNSFSGYDYFTPEQVAKLVNDACKETNTICLFGLLKDEYGFYGKIDFTDLESGESISTETRTEKPAMKATNETQQMGGMLTYTKRYALMSLFDIEDNSIDFDSDASQSKNSQQTPKQPQQQSEKKWLNEGTREFDGALKKLSEGTTTIDKIKAVFNISKTTLAKLLAAEKKD